MQISKVAVVAALCMQANALTPDLNSISVNSCVRAGKCLDAVTGAMDPTVCCSGMCDKDDGCISTTEAMSIMSRLTLSGSPFICREDSFFGVRSCTPVFFNSGDTPADCACEEDKPCIIGNEESAACSTRFWIGHCDSSESACLPQIAVSVDENKTIFRHAAPTADLGLGGPCTGAPDECAATDPSLECKFGDTCTVHVLKTPAYAFGDISFGLEFDSSVSAMIRELDSEGNGTPGVCGLATPSTTAGTKCLCNSDCDSDNGYFCVIDASGTLHTVASTDIANDLSLTGTCLKETGSTCATDDECIPGRVCQSATCVLTAGGSECDGNFDCVTGTTCGASERCELPAGGSCRVNEECVNTCMVPPGADFGLCT